MTAPKATLRMKLEAHIHDPKCASCHSKIDPLGLAFENFDAIGRWRTHEVVEGTGDNPPVNASGKLHDGRSYKTPEEFKQLLLGDVETFNAAFVERLATMDCAAACPSMIAMAWRRLRKSAAPRITGSATSSKSSSFPTCFRSDNLNWEHRTTS